MTTEDTKAVIVTPEQAISTYVKAQDDFDNVRPQDRITPRIRLQQLTSPAVGEGRANPGDMLLDSGELLIKRGQSTLFVPLMQWLQWVEFNPNMDAPKDKKVLDRSVDPNSTLAQRAAKYEEVINSKGKKGFAVTESYNFVGLCPSIGFWDTLYIMSFQRSGHRVGKGLINTLMSVRGADGSRMPMFTSMFELSALYKDEGQDKKYFIPSLNNRKETPQAQWPILAQLVDKLRNDKKAMMDRELEREKAEAEVETAAVEEKHF